MTQEQNGAVRSAKYDIMDEDDGGQGRIARRKRLSLVISLLVVVLALLILLVADGVRRENDELQATLEAFSGEVTVCRGGEEPGDAAESRMILRAKDVVVTGADSTATIVFADGSAIQVEPNTRFTVETLDFARGGVRNRTFLVEYGSAVSRVSRFFGAESRSSLRTPTAVAAARGTGYRMRYNEIKRLSRLQVAVGTVDFGCGGKQFACGAGKMLSAVGSKVGPAQNMSRDERERLLVIVQTLEILEHAPGGLQNLEWWLTGRLNPVLRLTHIGPTGGQPEEPAPDMSAALDETVKGLGASLEEQPEDLKPEGPEIAPETGERRRLVAGFLFGHRGDLSGNVVGDWTPHVGSFDADLSNTKRLTDLVFEEVGGSGSGQTPGPESGPEETPPAGAASGQETPPVQMQVLAEGPIETLAQFQPTIGALAAGAGSSWLIPGILGAGAAAAALTGQGGGDSPQPVPEPSGLLALSAFAGLALAFIRRRR